MSFETGFVIAAVAAVLFFILYVRSSQQLRGVKDLEQNRRQDYDKQIIALRGEKDGYLQDKISLGNDLIEQRTRYRELQEKLETQTMQWQQLQAHFKIEFENLATKLLEEKSEKFTRQNQVNLENLLKPLQEKIKDFEKKVEETYQQESRERFSLQKELQRMYALNQTLSEQATNLTKALKSDTKKQGNWGEYLLTRILETSGLEEGIHYMAQATYHDADGSRKRPDVVILLPEGRHVALDAKVSLTAYERYFSATDEQTQRQALLAHVQSVRRHVDELSAKNYEKLLDHSPDFVLMFIPVEPAYGLALMQDPDLFEYAFRDKVILVSVSSLLATLRIIDSMWRLEKQNRHAAEIVRQGSALYEKFVNFVTDLQALGKSLEDAQQAYDKSLNKLSTGKGNLIGRAENMKKLGLDAKKQLPQALITRSDEIDE